MTNVRSAQGRKVVPLAYVKCRAFQKHELDGGVYEENHEGRKVWVAKLQCSGCGTWRYDVMTPVKCELISRGYSRPDDYDGKMSPDEARKILYKHLVANGVSLSSLKG